MISEITDINDLSGGKASPLYPRVFSAFETRISPFDGVYKQTDRDKNPTAIFSCVDGHCTFIFSLNTDKEELESFLKFGEISSVTSCNRSDIPKSAECSEFHLMKFCGTALNEDAEMLKASDKSEVYKELFSSFGDYLSISDFSVFYCELASKISKNQAAFFYVRDKNAPLSFAAAPNICENSAIISGVFTKKDFRAHNYASRCVSALTFELKRRGIGNIFLWCDTATAGFYERLGYKEVSKIFIGRLK